MCVYIENGGINDIIIGINWEGNSPLMFDTIKEAKNFFTTKAKQMSMTVKVTTEVDSQSNF